ncbi:MAG: hypothetical protein MUF10_18815 [Thermoanaerobaculaceae bacterium]|jgi:hypothetical protein|nr:hypothetical protein [Thermoanaerobaculaceae bacterium]
MKAFLSVAAVLIVLLGGAWLVFPEAMLGRWGVQTDAVGLFMGRRYGTMLLGFAVILGLGRSSGPSSARTAILGGGALASGLVTLVGVGGILTGTVGPGAWITVAVEALLTGGFLCFLLVGRAAPQPAASEK